MKKFYQYLLDFKKSAVSISFTLLFAGAVHATVYTVNTTTDGTGINQLRGALMEAGNTPGTHTINVAAGTYFIDANAILLGTADDVDITINGAGFENTIIDGLRRGRGLVINPDRDQKNLKVAFNGLTFQNFISNTILGGGAVLALYGLGNTLSFDNCWFLNNLAYHDAAQPGGGAIFCYDVSLSVKNCVFSGNTNTSGSGGAIEVGFREQVSTTVPRYVNISNSSFTFNSAIGPLPIGGAISVYAVAGPGPFSTSVTGCTFTSNSCDEGWAGAIGWYSRIDGSLLNINYNRFTNNTAFSSGAVKVTQIKSVNGNDTYPVSDLLNIKNNWWGCNEGPVGCVGIDCDDGPAYGCGDYGKSSNGFAAISTPFLQLKTTLSAPTICYPGTNSVQVTTGFTSNSANETIDPANLGAFVGRPVNFAALPGNMGNISGIQTKIQANGKATANFISNGTPGVVQIYSNSDNSSNTAPLKVYTPGSWLGTSSNDWYLPANWCGAAIPTIATNVTIPAGTLHVPNIKSAFDAAVANNITIENGAVLDVGSFGTLDVKGNFTNNGSFNANASGALTVFSGPGDQTVPGADYELLSIAGGGVKTLTANASLNLQFGFAGNSKMALGNNTLTFNTHTNAPDANATQYFITNGSGGLKKKNIGASEFIFPIGSATSYMPVVLSNTGTPDHFTARVGEGVYTSYLNNVPQGSPVALKAVNSTWYISEAIAGGSNVGMSLYWNPADELTSFDRGNCYVAHYTGDRWNSVTGGAASGGNPYFVSRSGITSFSPFAVTNPDSPLPVTLSHFDAVREGSTALLSWSTTEETNSERFEIERSINGKIWQKIGTVKSGGESKVLADYHFLDANPVGSQENLYRLKMVDRDQTYAYSRIKSLKFDDVASSVVYPNPVSIKLFVRDFTHVSSLQIIDMSGKLVSQSGIMKNDGISVNKLSAGVHIVEIKWLDGRTTTQKIVINP